jgi:hypothetical protein
MLNGPVGSRHGIPARDHAAARAKQQRAEQSSAAHLTCTQTVASKRSVPPHLRPLPRVRRGCCPRQPWRVRIARWAGSPRRDPHRAAPTEALSSRTKRVHVIPLHGPTRVSGVKRHGEPILYTAPPMHHVALDVHLCARFDARSPERAAVPTRVSPPDPGATRHGTPARHHAAARAQQSSSARSNRRCDI